MHSDHRRGVCRRLTLERLIYTRVEERLDADYQVVCRSEGLRGLDLGPLEDLLANLLAPRDVAVPLMSALAVFPFSGRVVIDRIDLAKRPDREGRLGVYEHRCWLISRDDLDVLGERIFDLEWGDRSIPVPPDLPAVIVEVEVSGSVSFPVVHVLESMLFQHQGMAAEAVEQEFRSAFRRLSTAGRARVRILTATCDPLRAIKAGVHWVGAIGTAWAGAPIAPKPSPVFGPGWYEVASSVRPIKGRRSVSITRALAVRVLSVAIGIGLGWAVLVAMAPRHEPRRIGISGVGGAKEEVVDPAEATGGGATGEEAQPASAPMLEFYEILNKRNPDDPKETIKDLLDMWDRIPMEHRSEVQRWIEEALKKLLDGIPVARVDDLLADLDERVGDRGKLTELSEKIKRAIDRNLFEWIVEQVDSRRTPEVEEVIKAAKDRVLESRESRRWLLFGGDPPEAEILRGLQRTLNEALNATVVIRYKIQEGEWLEWDPFPNGYLGGSTTIIRSDDGSSGPNLHVGLRKGLKKLILIEKEGEKGYLEPAKSIDLSCEERSWRTSDKGWTVNVNGVKWSVETRVRK